MRFATRSLQRVSVTTGKYATAPLRRSARHHDVSIEWSQASASIWRYNARMAIESRCQVPSTPHAFAVPTYSGTALSPEELAEFIDAIEYDDAPAAVANSTDYDPDY